MLYKYCTLHYRTNIWSVNMCQNKILFKTCIYKCHNRLFVDLKKIQIHFRKVIASWMASLIHIDLGTRMSLIFIEDIAHILTRWLIANNMYMFVIASREVYIVYSANVNRFGVCAEANTKSKMNGLGNVHTLRTQILHLILLDKHHWLLNLWCFNKEH